MPFIVDRNARQSCIDSLKKFDSDVILSCDCRWIYSPVNTHPDIQIHFVDREIAFVPSELYEYYKHILPNYIDLRIGNKSLGGTYPSNIAYNIARIGDCVILNEKYADEKIVEYYKDNGFRIINVNQGYAKCNICTDGCVAVTEDNGIYKALIKNNIKTLKIPVGQVFLNGFSYGFIGGASGFFANKILFYGQLKDTSLFNEIKNFFEESGCFVYSLDKERLTDYGSILYFE